MADSALERIWSSRSGALQGASDRRSHRRSTPGPGREQPQEQGRTCATAAGCSQRRADRPRAAAQAVNAQASVFGTAHFDNYQTQGGALDASAVAGGFAGAWHVFSLEWTLESLAWCGADRMHWARKGA